MARVNQVVAFTQHEDGTQTFRVGIAGEVTFHPDAASPANRTHAELHGWKQRLSDKAAIPRDPKTGKSATDAEKLAAIRGAVEHYESGSDDWEMKRAATGGRRTDASFIIEALAFVQGTDIETMTERVGIVAEKNRTTVEAYLKKAAQIPAVAAHIAVLKYVTDGDTPEVNLDDLNGTADGE